MMGEKKIRRLVVIMAGLLVALTCQGQQKPAIKPTVADQLIQLRSKQWTERAKAFQQLSTDDKTLSDAQVREALLDLLNRENQLIESTLRDSHGQVGVSEKYGEDYGEYVDQLGATVDSFANWNDSHQVCIFVHESYNAESRFAAKIAAHASIAVPCLIQMYSSDVGLTRAEAAPGLVQALAKGGKQLDPATVNKVKQIIQTALLDSDDAVRSSTITALGKFGEVDMVPALRKVAETDPSPEIQGYSIRKSAVEAIAAIQKRTSSPQN
jgi:hypothetical protein